jgi:hypothetical protein
MEKGKTPFCAKIGIVMPLLSFKFNAQIHGEFLYFLMNCQDFISKVESYLCCHQSPIKGEIENASRPLIDFGD